MFSGKEVSNMAADIDLVQNRTGIAVGSLLIGVLIGAVVGGVAALLLAPQSGNETQRMIRDRAMQTGQMFQDRYNTIRDRVSKTGSNMRSRAESEMQAATSGHPEEG
jgi:gas vesicle protein